MSDSNVIDFGEMSFRIKRERYIKQQGECPHLHVELDDNGDVVTCLDCKLQVSAYWALKMLTKYWQKKTDALNSRAEAIEENLQSSLHLIAAKTVEKVWRTKHMVPCCPHCGNGIMASDGLGLTQMSKAIEIRRRESASKVKP